MQPTDPREEIKVLFLRSRSRRRREKKEKLA